jgi:hypothetical protein
MNYQRRMTVQKEEWMYPFECLPGMSIEGVPGLSTTHFGEGTFIELPLYWDSEIVPARGLCTSVKHTTKIDAIAMCPEKEAHSTKLLKHASWRAKCGGKEPIHGMVRETRERWSVSRPPSQPRASLTMNGIKELQHRL